MIHSKVVVVDPFGANPVVMTGSHNLGPKASGQNDDNLVIVEGAPGLAAAYAVNILGIYDQYKWRYNMLVASKAAAAATVAAPPPAAVGPAVVASPPANAEPTNTSVATIDEAGGSAPATGIPTAVASPDPAAVASPAPSAPAGPAPSAAAAVASPDPTAVASPDPTAVASPDPSAPAAAAPSAAAADAPRKGWTGLADDDAWQEEFFGGEKERELRFWFGESPEVPDQPA
jgi:hypothetical protein